MCSSRQRRHLEARILLCRCTPPRLDDRAHAAFAATCASLCAVSTSTDEVQFIVRLLRRSVFAGRPHPKQNCCRHSVPWLALRARALAVRALSAWALAVRFAPPRVSCSGGACRARPARASLASTPAPPVLTLGGLRLNGSHVFGCPAAAARCSLLRLLLLWLPRCCCGRCPVAAASVVTSEVVTSMWRVSVGALARCRCYGPSLPGCGWEGQLLGM